MKNHNQKKFNQLFLLVFAVACSHLAFTKYQQTRHLSYWDNMLNERSISSYPSGRFPNSSKNFNQDAIDNLRDYFNFSTFKKYVEFDLSLDFSSNVPNLQKQQEWKPLFHRSLEKTLSPYPGEVKNLESIFLTAFNDNLLKDFTENFLLELNNQEIAKGQFQVDLVFRPKLTSQFSYNPEIESNNLIHWGQTNSFFSDIEEKEKRTNQSLAKHILETQLPNTSPDYQYRGGIISIWFEVSGEGEAQNASGFVRFRKYYTAPHIRNLEPYIQQDDLRLTMIHFKKEKVSANDLFLTSDFYQSYSLTDPKPKAQRLELHFGKLLGNNLNTANIATRSLASISQKSKKQRDIQVGSLNLHGVVKYDGKEHLFNSKVESLVFDFESGEFHKSSKIRTSFKDKKIKGHRKGALKHKVSEKLLDEHGLELIKRFRLRTLHRRFRGVSSSNK